MNYVDVILMTIVVLAIWAGWRKGFILGSINLAVWIGSMVLGFFFYQYISNVLEQYIPRLGVWNLPLAFLITIILARIVLAFIFNTVLSRTPDDVHGHGANRIFGIIPGMINGLIYATIIAALLLSVPLKHGISDTTKESLFASKLGVNAGWLDDKLSPILISLCARRIELSFVFIVLKAPLVM